MKKVLLSLTVLSSLLAFGQVQESNWKVQKAEELPATLEVANKVMTVQDTLTQPVFGANCDPRLYTITSGGRPVAGTFALSTGDVITDVSQLLNLGSDPVEVEALLFFTNRKVAGPSKGSFTAEIYDTVGGPSPLRPDYTPEATSASITFDNIDTAAAGINRFAFSTPYATRQPFWASLKVDNGSDTLSVFTTSDDCGGAQPTALMNVNDTLWLYYANVFSSGGGANPLDFALWVWAEVDTSNNTIGLNRNFISKAGLKMYPNPVENITTIKYSLPNEKNLTLLVQDMAGREVFRKQFSQNNENSIEVDLAQLQSGPHTYQIVGEKKQLNGVFVKK